MEDVTLDDLKDELPEHQPRFVLYTFPYTHADERISYPLCLIFSSPRESKTELMVMYAGSKLELEKRAEVHKVYEVCDLDDLSIDLIKEKLAKWEKTESKKLVKSQGFFMWRTKVQIAIHKTWSNSASDLLPPTAPTVWCRGFWVMELKANYLILYLIINLKLHNFRTSPTAPIALLIYWLSK